MWETGAILVKLVKMLFLKKANILHANNIWAKIIFNKKFSDFEKKFNDYQKHFGIKSFEVSHESNKFFTK